MKRLTDASAATSESTLSGPGARCPICEGGSFPDERFAAHALRHCPACDFRFAVPNIQPVNYDEAYFSGYAGGDYLHQEAQRRHESRIRLRSLRAVCAPPASLLEIGCAAGFMLDEARALGYACSGIEPNPEMARHARELGLDVAAVALDDAQLPEGCQDIVCAFHVLEHLPEPLNALRLMATAARPGGWVVLEVPNAASAGAMRLGARWQPLDLPWHVGHHSPRSLASVIHRAGLKLVVIDTISFAYYARGPRSLRVARCISEALRTGAPVSLQPHPWAHQLLRALARRPS